eukprot:2578340-Rhodomonas_salina.1
MNEGRQPEDDQAARCRVLRAGGTLGLCERSVGEGAGLRGARVQAEPAHTPCPDADRDGGHRSTSHVQQMQHESRAA